MTFSSRLRIYAQLMRLNKPIGILLLLWPTLWGLWIAGEGHPDPTTVLIFILGTVLMRSAGCIINDYADRDFDAHVARTRERPLARKILSSKEALILAAALALLAFCLILPLNHLVWALSAGALFLAATYPFTKRFLAIPQAYLGITFGFGIPMAFAALRHETPLLAWILLLANTFWAIAYDTEYAITDREDDLKIGIKTSAITFGRFDISAIMTSYGLMLVLLSGVGYALQRGMYYYGGIVIAIGITIYHYTLIRQRHPQQCFKAFLHNNWIGAVIFIGIGVDYSRLSSH